MSLEADYLGAFEEHSPDRIRNALASGTSPTKLIKRRPLADCLIEDYWRSAHFAECLQILIEAGAALGDPALARSRTSGSQRSQRILGADDLKAYLAFRHSGL